MLAITKITTDELRNGWTYCEDELQTNLSVAETSLCLNKTDDVQFTEVDLQPLVDATIYLLFWTPGAATSLCADPSVAQ